MKAQRILGLSLAALALPLLAGADEVTVKITNLSPPNGTYLTPVWVGFHDGTFDTYDLGAAAPMSLERLAEDGDTGPQMDAFMSSGVGTSQGTIVSDMGIPPVATGETATMAFILDGDPDGYRYFSYASMVIPSNDAFIANDNPTAHSIVDVHGDVVGLDFFVWGSQANDAGTELNDEDPAHTAFFGQMMPNTGQDENVGVHPHVGFKFPGSGGILDDPMFSNGDFTAPGYQLAHIVVLIEDSGDENGDDDDDDDDDGGSGGRYSAPPDDYDD